MVLAMPNSDCSQVHNMLNLLPNTASPTRPRCGRLVSQSLHYTGRVIDTLAWEVSQTVYGLLVISSLGTIQQASTEAALSDLGSRFRVPPTKCAMMAEEVAAFGQ